MKADPGKLVNIQIPLYWLVEILIILHSMIREFDEQLKKEENNCCQSFYIGKRATLICIVNKLEKISRKELNE